MGYGMHFPAHQVGGQLELWDIRGYGLSGLWVMTGPTVYCFQDHVALTMDNSNGDHDHDRQLGQCT